MRLGRRSLLLMTGGAAVAGAYSQSPFWLHPDSSENGVREQHAFAGRALGATVRLTLRHANFEVASHAARAAFQALEEIEQTCSLYRPNSQLCQLNRAGVLPNPHPDLVTILRAAYLLSQRTDGAFDVTVQPLWDLYSRAAGAGELPSASELLVARRRIDWRRLRIQDDEIRCEIPGMAVTLNGIAQGFAADRVAEVLASHGITCALVDTGELAARGQAWNLGVRDPRRPGQLATTLRVENRCLATSGDYATPFSSDFRHHHIFDPRTGHSPTELASVSVLAPTAMMADALSTAIMVLGPVAGQNLIRQFPGTEARMIGAESG